MPGHVEQYAACGLTVTGAFEAMWAAAAQELGLIHSGPLLHGRLSGHEVRVQHVATVESHGHMSVGEPERTNVTCWFDLPMDLGLQLWDRKVVDRMVYSPPTGARARTGDEGIDGRYLVVADEPLRAQALLSGTARRLLLEPPEHAELFLNDQTLSLNSPTQLQTAAAVVRAVRGALEAAAIIYQARSQVPAAQEVALHGSVWGAFARSHGLRLMLAPPCMWGCVHRVEVAVHGHRKDARSNPTFNADAANPITGFVESPVSYPTRVQVSFPQFLGMALAIRPQTGTDKLAKIFGRQDVRFDHRAFDDAFLVQTSSPERVKELLSEPVRASLLAAHEAHATVTADDEAIVAELPDLAPDPAVVPEMVEQLATAAELIGRGAGMRARAPYR